MESLAIIAEFNPFHTGHARLIRQVRQAAGPEAAIVIIMSGAFVQRGEPAFFDKWHRAAWAIDGGADVVIELPAVYALSSAAGFAQGGVTLAARLGCQALACGVEGGTAADFLSLARRAEGLTACLKAAKKASAGQQLTDALMAAAPDEARLLQQPNALLAFEYARAMLKQEQPLAFLPLPRQGRHGNTGLGAAFASASALRQAMRCSGTAAACRPYLTAASLASAEDQLAQGAFTDYGRYGDFVASQNRLLTPDQLRSLPAFTEGLENRWHRAFMESGSYDQALRSIKTRRYAYSRLCRMGAYTLLQPSRDLMDQSYEAGPQYARLLALNGYGAAFLKGAKGQLPIVTKVRSDAFGLSPLGREQLKLDLKASNIQSFCFSKEDQRKGHQDYYHSPLFLSIKK